ncbi:MAG: hypothetical protein AAGF59_12205 [Pseudomonadota bacterium]
MSNGGGLTIMIEPEGAVNKPFYLMVSFEERMGFMTWTRVPTSFPDQYAGIPRLGSWQNGINKGSEAIFYPPKQQGRADIWVFWLDNVIPAVNQTTGSGRMRWNRVAHTVRWRVEGGGLQRLGNMSINDRIELAMLAAIRQAGPKIPDAMLQMFSPSQIAMTAVAFVAFCVPTPVRAIMLVRNALAIALALWEYKDVVWLIGNFCAACWNASTLQDLETKAAPYMVELLIRLATDLEAVGFGALLGALTRGVGKSHRKKSLDNDSVLGDISKRAGLSVTHLDNWRLFTLHAKPPKLVVLRTSKPASLDFHGRPGFKPKPLEVKIKVDPHTGLVRKPTDKQLAALSSHDRAKVLKDLKEVGKPGSAYYFDEFGNLCDLQGNKFYSDVDKMGVYDLTPVKNESGKTVRFKGKNWDGKIGYGEDVKPTYKGQALRNDSMEYQNKINKMIYEDVKLDQHGRQDMFVDRDGNAIRSPDPDETFVVVNRGIVSEVNLAGLKTIYADYALKWPYNIP